jgi:NADH:ubiquinone oxidoreductase subunit C
MSEEKTSAEEVKSQLGEFGTLLSDMKIKIKALGNNASGVEMLEVEPSDLIQVCKELKRSKKMNFLNYMTAVEVKNGYQSIIQLEDHESMKYLVIKTSSAKSSPKIPSLTELYPNANWFEREGYDMIGIEYEGHPNLTRILNPDNWDGFPLRKDYIGPVDELNRPVKLNR